MRNTILILLIWASAASLHAGPVSHLYYLSIGNGYYTDDHYTTIDDVNYSAGKVAQLLQPYGTGKTYLSGSTHILSKQDIMRQVDSFLITLAADTLGVGVLYYCGHGQSDYDGNMYMIPGAVNMHWDSMMRMQAITQLVNISEIQLRFMSRVLPLYMMEGSVTSARAKLCFVQSMEERNNETFSDEGLIGIMLRATASRKETRALPKLIIMADCCYGKFDTKEDIFTGRINSDIEDSFMLKNFMDSPDSLQKGDGLRKAANAILRQVSLSQFFEIMKNIYESTDNKVLFARPIDSVVHMVSAPSSDMSVGPVARRLILFFGSHRHAFTLGELMTRLADASFDAATTGPAYLENKAYLGKMTTGNNATAGDVDQYNCAIRHH